MKDKEYSREVKIFLSYEDKDAINTFLAYHTEGSNILLREWLEDGGGYRSEKIKYTFVEKS